jgi:predicted MFS family arabinose efflux permease
MPQLPLLQLSSIWQQRSFRNLWLGTTVSAFGSEISGVAIPLTAVLLLGATSAQMGVLRAVGTCPALLFGFVAGVWIDRLRRRPILIIADIGRALLLAMLPLAAIFDSLDLPLLYLIAFTTGTLTIFFDIVYLSFVPSLVRNDDLLEANVKVNFSLSLAGVLGPGVAGVLVQLIAAPFAVALDALSFLISALFLCGIARDEPPAPVRSQRSVLAEIGEGLRQVYRHSLLRPMALCLALHFFSMSVRIAVYLIYLLRILQITPGWLGIILAGYGPGALLGTALTQRLVQRFGMGATVLGGACINCVAAACIPLTGMVPALAVPLLFTINVSFGFGIALLGPMDTLRQIVTVPELRGRMNASFRSVNMILATAGALVGGFLGEIFGLEATLVVSSLGLAAAALVVFVSPLRRVQNIQGV